MGLLNAGSGGAGVFVGRRRLEGPYTVRCVVSSTTAAPWFQPLVVEMLAKS